MSVLLFVLLTGCAIGAYPGQIKTVKIESLSASGVVLSWTAPGRNPVAYYEVHLCEGEVVSNQVGGTTIDSYRCLTDPDGKALWEYHERSMKRQLTIDGLQAGRSYVALVEAVPAEDGMVEISQPLQFTTPLRQCCRLSQAPQRTGVRLPKCTERYIL